MLRNKVKANPDAKGFIFDGFPRTIPQAEALDMLMKEEGTAIHALVALQVEDAEIIQRIILRGATSGRTDDLDESIIRNRIEVYKSETTPVYDFYDGQNKSYSIAGLGSIDAIFERLCAVIDSLQEHAD
jgi:adenylate kinase